MWFISDAFNSLKIANVTTFRMVLEVKVLDIGLFCIDLY